MAFSTLPEIILIVLEFPVYTILTWACFCFTIFYGQWLTFISALVLTPVLAYASIILYLFIGSRFSSETMLEGDYKNWIIIKDPALKSWEGKRMPIREAYEWYFRGKIDFAKPCLEIFLHRHHLFRFVFSINHLQEIINGVFAKAWIHHDKDGDAGEIKPVYNLGNEFYHDFLGDPMFYSCGVAYEQDESLEVAQKRKCGIVAEQLDIKDGDRVLDFGCGWGSWLIYVAQNFDVECHGLTISVKQLEYANARIKKLGLEKKITLHLIDYREMTVEKYGQFDKITNFEMSEHVGVRKYQEYVAQVKALLKQDGRFFLQIAGLRRAWQYEDLLWGIFMAKYIFPGADASCPAYWNVNQYERGGFEVMHIRNQGVHYAHTIEAWYRYIKKNQQKVIERDGQFAYRRHELFLAWSTMIARQGSSTVWTMLMTHNTPVDAFSSANTPVTLNRSKMLINRDQYISSH